MLGFPWGPRNRNSTCTWRHRQKIEAALPTVNHWKSTKTARLTLGPNVHEHAYMSTFTSAGPAAMRCDISSQCPCNTAVLRGYKLAGVGGKFYDTCWLIRTHASGKAGLRRTHACPREDVILSILNHGGAMNGQLFVIPHSLGRGCLRWRGAVRGEGQSRGCISRQPQPQEAWRIIYDI